MPINIPDYRIIKKIQTQVRAALAQSATALAQIASTAASAAYAPQDNTTLLAGASANISAVGTTASGGAGVDSGSFIKLLTTSDGLATVTQVPPNGAPLAGLAGTAQVGGSFVQLLGPQAKGTTASAQLAAVASGGQLDFTAGQGGVLLFEL